MKPRRICLAISLAALTALPLLAQTSFRDTAKPPEKMSPRAEAYYNFALGHLYEIQFEQTSQSEYATRSIEAYKKAYSIDPQSPIIGERLAEMYWKAQRVHDAVTEANEILKRDPNNLATHRLLGRIYLRSLGDINNGSSGVQNEMVAKAIAEFSEVHRLDPADMESALWLARLFRLHNQPEK
ncbi:MAG TPA: tetratricopeptide repeat protein, partial [Geobacterales bacterium]|nr:tetratricopeptide repeat protein [Geobacterales bacterium]